MNWHVLVAVGLHKFALVPHSNSELVQVLD